MSANLTYRTDANGNRVANVFTRRLPAWHREGVLFESDAPSMEEARTAAGHDFEVGLQPLVAQLGGIYVPTPAFATYRTDTNAILGVVGNRYTPLQNDDAFKGYEPLIESGLIELETGGTLNAGRDVWLLGRINTDKVNGIVQDVFGSEGILPYALISNNHAGRRKAIIQETAIRVVCSNTLGAAVRNRGTRSITVSHTGNVVGKVDAAVAKLWGDLVRNLREQALQLELLRLRKLTDKQLFELVLDVAAPLPAKKPETKRAENGLARTVQRREQITRLWTEGDGHTGDRSAFEAFSAVTQTLDHDDAVWTTRGDNSRLASLWGGHLSQVKQNVLKSLIDDAVSASEEGLLDRIAARHSRTSVSVDRLIAATN